MLNSVFEQAPTSLLLIDPIQDRIVNANAAARTLFALEQTAIASTRATAIFKACLGELHCFSQQVLETKRASTSALFIVQESPCYLDIDASDIDGLLLFSCETSENNYQKMLRAKAQHQYQAGLLDWYHNDSVFDDFEKLNKLLLTAVGDGIYGVDAQGCTTFVNSASERILGWRRNELIGKKIHDIIHHTHHDGSHYHVHQCPIYSAFRDGKVHVIESEVFWAKSGQAIPVEYTSTPVIDNGELVGAVVVFRDISERQKTQQRLLAAFDEIASLKKKLEVENAYLIEEIKADFNHHRIIGKSTALQRLIQQIELVASTEANVLIVGESGTGKELVARALHDASQRKSRPLIKVNCAAIPADLFESEFFGHVKGAFSGAVSDRIGRFELADGGTIFLDEIGEIPLQLQSKLLRVLQEQQFEPVGDSNTRSVNVRVIAATNQNLKRLVEQQKFREDLYFRLNVFPIDSPPLRERIEDIPLLLQHFVTKICHRFNQPKPKISAVQLEHLKSYQWPGNIRELENIIERQVILAKGGKLDFSFLSKQNRVSQTIKPQAMQESVLSKKQYQALEVNNIKRALGQCKGKIYGPEGAAELLGLPPTTLASKIKKYQIDRKAAS